MGFWSRLLSLKQYLLIVAAVAVSVFWLMLLLYDDSHIASTSSAKLDSTAASKALLSASPSRSSNPKLDSHSSLSAEGKQSETRLSGETNLQSSTAAGAAAPTSGASTYVRANLQPRIQNADSRAGALLSNVPWSQFLQYTATPSVKNSRNGLLNTFRSIQQSVPFKKCSAEVEAKLNSPRLSDSEYKWCQWALKGGGVQIGRSWGKLSTAERLKYENLNCNSVASSANPTCAESWGDQHVRNWRANVATNLSCGSRQSSATLNHRAASTLRCHRNEINDQYCVMTNVQIDFRQARDAPNPKSGKLSREFTPSFLTLDCADASPPASAAMESFRKDFKMNYLFSPSLSSAHCDIVLNGTTLLYSHDNIRNLCHTYNDILNVWLLLYLEGLASSAGDVTLLTVDAMKLYNNFHDTVNDFFQVYSHSFHGIRRGVDFANQVVCAEKVILQTLPSRGFVWDNWQQDLPCSFVGPSSLYQRYNLHLRQSLGAIHKVASEDPILIVFIIRSETSNEWGSYRTSRLISNQRAVISAIETLMQQYPRFKFMPQDLSRLSFIEQIRLLSRTSILMGMHGAGISHVMHMPIGSHPHCCGLLEIFPQGEFFPVKGFANIARKLGFHYRRLDVDAAHSLPQGAEVDAQALGKKLTDLMAVMQDPNQATCVLPSVLEDPFSI